MEFIQAIDAHNKKATQHNRYMSNKYKNKHIEYRPAYNPEERKSEPIFLYNLVNRTTKSYYYVPTGYMTLKEVLELYKAYNN